MLSRFKKGRLVLFALILMLVLVACGKKEESSLEDQAGSSTQTDSEVVSSVSEEEESSESGATGETKGSEEILSDEKRIFKDSLGREVELPEKINKIAVSGPLAQIAIFAIAPEKMVGIASPWDDLAKKYLPEDFTGLPIIGQLYGGKGELNLEELLNSGAEVVIDVGEPKKNMAEDLDRLQEQTGIPFIHVTASLETSAEAYRILGDLFDKEKEGEERAVLLDRIYSRAKKLQEELEPADLLFITGEEGLNVIAQGSFQGEVVDLLANNIAVVDDPSPKGTGNEVTMEQIITWNPSLIIIGPNSIYDRIGDDPNWQEIQAIQDGKYYEIPAGPHNWINSPPSVQRFLGILWLSDLLYSDKLDYDTKAEVQEYYRLFYHIELTDDQYTELVENSLLKEGQK